MSKRPRDIASADAETQQRIFALQNEKRRLKDELLEDKEILLKTIDHREKIIKIRDELDRRIYDLETRLGVPHSANNIKVEQKQLSQEDNIKLNKIINFFVEDEFPYEKAKAIAEILILNVPEELSAILNSDD